MSYRKVELRCPECGEYRDTDLAAPEESFDATDPMILGGNPIPLSCGHQTRADDYDLRAGEAVSEPEATPTQTADREPLLRSEVFTVADSATISPNSVLNMLGGGWEFFVVPAFPATMNGVVAGLFALHETLTSPTVATFEATLEGQQPVNIGVAVAGPPVRPTPSRVPKIPFIMPYQIVIPEATVVTITASANNEIIGSTSFEVRGP